MFHVEEGRPVEFIVTCTDLVARFPQHSHPVADKVAFAGRHVVEAAREGSRAAAAFAVAHHQYLADFKLRDREFKRCRDAVKAAARFIRWGEGGDIPGDEHLARAGVENHRRIASAVGAGEDHDLGILAFGELGPAFTLMGPVFLAKAAITFDQLLHVGHRMRLAAGGQGWQAANTVAISPPMNAPAAIPPKQRKPDWIRVKAPVSEGYHSTRRLMRELNLATVCEEAACPNIGECWTKKHATVMILGDTCTRACAFCNVKTGMPRAVDPLEPEHVATAAAELGLEHIVVTSVDRDDLADGGASQFVKVIEALRKRTPATT